MANGQIFTSLPLKTDGFLGTEVFALAAPGTPGSSVSYGLAANNIFKIIGSLPVYPGHVPTTFSVGVFDNLTGLPYQATIAEIAVLGGNVPPGGTTGQVLAKLSDADYDTEWADFPTPPEPANTVLAGPVSGGPATAAFRALVGADLPNPAPTTLGGVKSLAPVTHQFLTSIGTDGTPTQAQPAFSDISGQATLAQLPTIADKTVLSNISGGAAVPAASSLSSIMDSSFSSTRGSILYRGAAGWAALGPGTAGQALVTGGAGADPAWSAGAVGTVTSVGLSVPALSIFGVTGSPVTTSGTLGLTTTGTSGGIPYFSSASVLSSSAALAANQLVLGGGAGVTPATLGSLGTTTQVLHGNAAGAPTWGAVSLTADVTGTLPVSNGGTGQTSFTAHGVVLGNGSSALAIASPGTAGQVFLSNGASADPAFGSVSTALDLLGNVRGDLLYRGASGWVVLAPGVSGQVLQSGGVGADPSWLTVTGTGTVTSVDVSGGTTGLTTSGGPVTTSGTITLAGTLIVGNGGTGRTTLTNHGVLVGAGTGAITQLAAAAAGTLLAGQGTGSDPSFTATPTLGITGSVLGTLALAGSSTGLVTVQPQAAAGTYNFNLPTGAGTSGQPLLSGGGGSNPMTFGTLDITAGGTNATSASAARTNLGLAIGVNVQAYDAQLTSIIGVNGKTANYTLALTDGAQGVVMTGSTSGQTITIPANGSIAFPVGTVVTIYNGSNQNWSIAITTDTLTWAPSGGTGTRTLAAAGLCTLWKVASTSWVISGVGLT